MKKRSKIKSVFIAIVILSFVLAPIRFDNFNFSDPNVQASSGIIISQDTVWKKSDNIILDKNVTIENGATLTIEKGATITFAGEPIFLEVSNGNIIAEGTQEEKITFTTRGEPFWDTYSIFFSDSGISNPSFFRYVEFLNGGYYPYVLFQDKKGGFLNKTYAYNGSGAVEYYSGKVHIENSEFKNSFQGAVNVNVYENTGYLEGNYIEIVNSNFENSGNGTALGSSVYCETETCKTKVIVKNNWYNNNSGPTFQDSYPVKVFGESLVGNYEFSGFRSSNLIVDPVVIIPGIIGSAEDDGEWKIDPILHTYDDLIESLEKNGYTKDQNLFELPYDWRNKNGDSAEKLKTKVEEIIKSTKISEVDLVAHSMGGLVARSYIEGDDYQSNIDQLITLGTPHRGSPEAYLEWEAGEGFFDIKNSIAKHHFEMEALHSHYSNLYSYIQEQVPSVKELLPDYDYLFDVSQNSIRSYPNNYPRNTFLENLNEESKIEKLKDIDFTNIVGVLSGEESTISKLRVVDSTVEDRWDNGMPENFYDNDTNQGLEHGEGDETVPEKSAEDVLANKTLKTNSSHNDLPTIAQCAVFQELTGLSNCASVVKTHIPSILLINIFSPIDIQIISPSGKKVGKDFATGKTFNEISGAFYTGYNTENEFVTIPNPEDGEYKILTQGMGTGEYKIEATKISEDVNNPSGEVKESTAEILGTTIPNKQEELKVAVVGDKVENIDNNSDKISPIVMITSPENKIYKNNQTIEIKYTVTDNLSSSDKIKAELFFDGKILDSKNNNKIDLSLEHLGSHTVSVIAEDEAGNKSEETKITFESKTDIGAIISNVNHYFNLNLISKKATKQLLLARLNAIKIKIELLKVFQSKWMSKFAKDKAMANMKKEINREIEKLISDIQNKKNFSENVDEKVREILVESLKFLNHDSPAGGA